MFGRICLLSHLVLDFSLLGVFKSVSIPVLVIDLLIFYISSYLTLMRLYLLRIFPFLPNIVSRLPRWWVKNPPASVGDARDFDWVSGSGRSPGVRNGNQLQNSFLGNFHWQRSLVATVHGVAKRMEWLSDWACTHVQVTCSSLLWSFVFLWHQL